MGFHMANEPDADRVLDEHPFALVMGMMLDQRYPMEHAFRGGYKVLSRFGTLDPAAIAAADPEKFKELCSVPPAIHRFPGSMAGRLQEARTRRGQVRRRRHPAVDRAADRRSAVQAGPGAARVRQAEVADLRRAARQAARRQAEGLDDCRRRLREEGLPLSRRRRRRRLAAEGARLQEAAEGVRGGLTPGAGGPLPAEWCVGRILSAISGPRMAAAHHSATSGVSATTLRHSARRHPQLLHHRRRRP